MPTNSYFRLNVFLPEHIAKYYNSFTNKNVFIRNNIIYNRFNLKLSPFNPFFNDICNTSIKRISISVYIDNYLKTQLYKEAIESFLNISNYISILLINYYLTQNSKSSIL